MRVIALILVLAFGTAGVAWAEKVKTNQATKVFSHAGEQSKVVLKVKSGQNMTVIGKEGRWFKVRVQGRTGYVPRSKVDAPDDDELVRNTRRRPFVDGRGTKRGFGGEAGPDDRVGADATGDGSEDKPNADDDDTPKKPTKKPKASDDDDKPKKLAKKPKASDDDDRPAKAAKKPKAGDDDDDDRSAKAAKRAKSDDDEEPKVSDDEDKADDAPKEDERAVAHVTEKSSIFNERDQESGAAFTAKPTELLYPGEQKGKWTFVENDEGEGGWIQTSKLDVDEPGGGPARKREIDLGARLGFTFISQGLQSAGSTAMPMNGFNVDRYSFGVSSFSVALGGGILVPWGKRSLVGGELAYIYSTTAGGGVSAPSGPGTSVNTGMSLSNLNVRAMAGYDLHKHNGMTVFGRLGFRYWGFIVDGNTPYDAKKNPAMFPSEVVKAPTLGAALAIPRLTDKVALKFSLDAILFGASITQTVGLEDGKSPSEKAVTVGATFTYHWKKDMDLQGIYELNYASLDFGAPVMTSLRMHTGTDTTRTDIFHTITFGIAKGF